MLFSCLIDADRIDTANFENSKLAKLGQDGRYVGWEVLMERLEKKLQDFEKNLDKTPVDGIRKIVSDACFTKANDEIVTRNQKYSENGNRGTAKSGTRIQ